MSSTLRRYIRESLLTEIISDEELQKKRAIRAAQEEADATKRAGLPAEQARYFAGQSNSLIDWVDAAWQDPGLFIDPDTVRFHGESPQLKFDALQAAIRMFGKKFPQKEPRLRGTGSSRYVYDLGDGTVLKLALDKRGIAQNSVEATAGQDDEVKRIIAQVKDYSDEFTWLISEKVEPLFSKKDFEASTGISFENLKSRLEAATEPRNEMSSGRCLAGDEFVGYLKKYLDRYKGMLMGDILKASSWGLTKSGCVVLLDYGISEATFKKLYRRSY